MVDLLFENNLLVEGDGMFLVRTKQVMQERKPVCFPCPHLVWFPESCAQHTRTSFLTQGLSTPTKDRTCVFASSGCNCPSLSQMCSYCEALRVLPWCWTPRGGEKGGVNESIASAPTSWFLMQCPFCIPGYLKKAQPHFYLTCAVGGQWHFTSWSNKCVPRAEPDISAKEWRTLMEKCALSCWHPLAIKQK